MRLDWEVRACINGLTLHVWRASYVLKSHERNKLQFAREVYTSGTNRLFMGRCIGTGRQKSFCVLIFVLGDGMKSAGECYLSLCLSVHCNYSQLSMRSQGYFWNEYTGEQD